MANPTEKQITTAMRITPTYLSGGSCAMLSQQDGIFPLCES